MRRLLGSAAALGLAATMAHAQGAAGDTLDKLSNFKTTGTTEFVTMGLLPEMADSVSVSIPAAGHVISAYALGVVVGAPVIAIFGARLPRRALIVALMVAFAVANVTSALAQDYLQLTVARFVSGVPHGAYFGVASLVAASMASEPKADSVIWRGRRRCMSNTNSRHSSSNAAARVLGAAP